MSEKTPAKSKPAKALKTAIYAATKVGTPFALRIGDQTIRPLRGSEGKVIWHVPVDLIDSLNKHEFVKTGRIAKVK